MSFSLDVKKELLNKMDTSRHCQIAEFAALMAFTARITESDDGFIGIESFTENPIVVDKIEMLLKTIFDVKETDYKKTSEQKNNKLIVINIKKQQLVASILQTIKWCDDDFSSIREQFIDSRIIQKDCCKKAFIRGAFLAAGSISDPNKFYHYEIVCSFEDDANKLVDILRFFDLDAKITQRKNNYVVYLKEGNNITDVLNLMGAVVLQMELYNIMIYKGISNDVNRKVNCETANLNKTIEAAVKQINDIEYIRDTVGLDKLKPNLREVAIARMENQDSNLKDLGEMLDPPVGKSGVNHRLRKIGEFADAIRTKRGEMTLRD